MEQTSDITIIAAETRIKGELHFEGAARVIGHVEGKITAKGDLHIDEPGVCKAQIEAANVRVDGSIDGNVKATQRVQLNNQARVQGDIEAEKLVTAEGATIQGHVNIGPRRGDRKAPPTPREAVEAAAAARK